MITRRAETIAKELEKLIIVGEFSNHQRLDETKLAMRFGVSRTPIREALQELTVSGLVERLPGRGVFVRQPGPVELLEMFEFMAEIEAICGRLAALRISDAALKSLRQANANCLEAVAQRDADAYYRENALFHKLIYQQSGNGFLEQEALKLHDRLKPYRRIQLHLRGRMKQSMAEHEAIMQALTNAEPNKAAIALRNHVAVQGEKFYHLMASLKATSQ